MKFKLLMIRLCFYNISLAPLFIMLAILKSDFSKRICDNTFSLLCVGLSFFSIPCLIILSDIRNDSKQLPITINSIANINYENLTFMATYIIPLVAFPLGSTKEKWVFLMLLLVIGIIFVKTNIFYSNPSLVILGFSIYRISDSTGKHNESVVITRGRIQANDKLQCLSLGDNIYYGKKLIV